MMATPTPTSSASSSSSSSSSLSLSLSYYQRWRRRSPHIAYPAAVAFFWVMVLVLFGIIAPQYETRWFSPHGESCEGDHRHLAICNNAINHATLMHSLVAGGKAFVQLLVSPVCGALSDHYGRRPFMIFSAVMGVLPPIALLMRHHAGVSLWWYWMTFVASGANCNVALAVSYISDVVTVASSRTGAFGTLLASLALSILLAPVFALFVSPLVVLWLMVGAAITSLSIAIVMPDTLQLRQLHQQERQCQRQREKEHQQRQCRESSSMVVIAAAAAGGDGGDGGDGAIGVGRINWCRTLNPFASFSLLWQCDIFIRLSIVGFLNDFVFYGLFDILILFGKRQFGFDQTHNSLVGIVLGSTGLLFQLGVLQPLCRWLSERRVVTVSLGLTTVATVLLAVGGVAAVHSQIMIYVAVGLLGAGLMVFPAVAALGVNSTTPDTIGLFVGALSGLRDCAQGLGPVAFGLLFTTFTRKQHGGMNAPYVPFVLGAVVFCIAAMVAWSIRPRLVPFDGSAWRRRRGLIATTTTTTATTTATATATAATTTTMRTTTKAMDDDSSDSVFNVVNMIANVNDAGGGVVVYTNINDDVNDDINDDVNDDVNDDKTTPFLTH